MAVRALLMLMLPLLAVLAGCTEPEPPDTGFVIKAGPVAITPVQFAEELDLKLTGYPYDIKSNIDEYNAMVLDLVSTLSDETVLLAAAKEKGITVTQDRLDMAEAEFKKDYPDDSFDRMLLETAISYPAWKNRLKKDMVIQKLIQQDLVDIQEITPEDMIAFYDSHKDPLADDGSSTGTADEKGLVEQLRMEKSQDAFEPWIQGLKTAYPVEIDKEAVAAFLMNR